MRANGRTGWDGNSPALRYVLGDPKYDVRLQHTFDGDTVETEAEGLQIVSVAD